MDLSGNNLKISIEENGHPADVRQKELLDRHDGSYIYRFRTRGLLKNVKISVMDQFQNHFKNSPMQIDVLNHANCNCPVDINQFYEAAKPSIEFHQVFDQFKAFPDQIDTEQNNQLVKERYTKNPGATALCKYVIKSNKLYRECHGLHVGFNMFR